MTVTIIENGIAVGTTTIATDTTYTLEVPLDAGDNSIVARETNGCGTIEESATILIRYSVPIQTSPNDQQQNLVTQNTAPSITSLTQTPNTPQSQTVVGNSTTSEYGPPTVTQPVTGSVIHSSPVWVKGEAQPGDDITILINGKSVAQVKASTFGDYGVVATSQRGNNTIQARDIKSASPIVYVTFQPIIPLQNSPVIDKVALTTVAASASAGIGVVAWRFYIPRLRIGLMGKK